MNVHVVFGALAFLLWSIFSSWYYTCKIKGLCIEKNEIIRVVEADISEPQIDVEEIDSDSSAVVELPAISIESSEIQFHKNTTTVSNLDDATQFLSLLKSEISGREVSVSVVGHTCDLGTEQYNLNLGQQRAESFRSQLTKIGINPASLSFSSKGESEPLVPNTNEAARAKNRRVEITIKSIKND